MRGVKVHGRMWGRLFHSSGKRSRTLVECRGVSEPVRVCPTEIQQGRTIGDEGIAVVSLTTIPTPSSHF